MLEFSILFFALFAVMMVLTMFIAGLIALATGPWGAAAAAAASYGGDEDDLFNMTNRLHGYVDDSRCDAMAEQIRDAERDVKELDPRRHLAGVWVSAE